MAKANGAGVFCLCALCLGRLLVIIKITNKVSYRSHYIPKSQDNILVLMKCIVHYSKEKTCAYLKSHNFDSLQGKNVKNSIVLQAVEIHDFQLNRAFI